MKNFTLRIRKTEKPLRWWLNEYKVSEKEFLYQLTHGRRVEEIFPPKMITKDTGDRKELRFIRGGSSSGYYDYVEVTERKQGWT